MRRLTPLAWIIFILLCLGSFVCFVKGDQADTMVGAPCATDAQLPLRLVRLETHGADILPGTAYYECYQGGWMRVTPAPVPRTVAEAMKWGNHQLFPTPAPTPTPRKTKVVKR